MFGILIHGINFAKSLKGVFSFVDVFTFLRNKT